MLNGKDVADVPGTDASKVEIPSVETIEKWLTKDLAACVSLLNALHSDSELRRQMAIFLQGRFSNSLNKVDPAQIKIPL